MLRWLEAPGVRIVELDGDVDLPGRRRRLRCAAELEPRRRARATRSSASTTTCPPTGRAHRSGAPAPRHGGGLRRAG